MITQRQKCDADGLAEPSLPVLVPQMPSPGVMDPSAQARDMSDSGG